MVFRCVVRFGWFGRDDALKEAGGDFRGFVCLDGFLLAGVDDLRVKFFVAQFILAALLIFFPGAARARVVSSDFLFFHVEAIRVKN